MTRLFPRRLAIAATGLGLLTATMVSTIPVGAAPPQAFTNNGCAVGNYSCLRSAVGSDYFRNNYRRDFPHVVPVPVIPPPAPAYVTPPYGAQTYTAPIPGTSTNVSVAIASGTVATTSGQATVGQPVTIAAGGFTAGESVTAAVVAPNGQSVAQAGPAAAASDGTVTITVMFPSPGAWQVTAHGQTSNKNVVNQYTVQ